MINQKKRLKSLGKAVCCLRNRRENSNRQQVTDMDVQALAKEARRQPVVGPQPCHLTPVGL